MTHFTINDNAVNHDLPAFLNALFPDLDGELIEVRRIGTGSPTSNYFESTESLIDWSLQESFTGNVYFGVCPRHERRGTKDAVRRLLCLWADLDDKDFAGGKEEALKMLGGFPVRPTAVVDSGNGYHAYWRLKEPEEATSALESFLKRLALALGADTHVCDRARILRLPGTLNVKDPSNPLPVNIVELDPDRECNLEDFESYLPEAEPEQAQNVPGWFGNALQGLGEGNRNDTFTRIAGRLNRDRYSPGEILALLDPHAEGCDFPLDELKTLVEGVCHRYEPKKAVPILPLAEELKAHEEHLKRFKGKEFIGIPQKMLPALDEMTLGLRGLMLLAAQPNVGKTALSVQLGLDSVMKNPDTCFLFLSLEMSRWDIMTRIKCRLAGVEYKKLMFGDVTSDEKYRLLSANDKLEEIGRRICILDDRNFKEPTVEGILSFLEEFKARSGAERALVLVDYLQVFPTPESVRTDLEADKCRMGMMKRLRDETGDAVLVISEARKPSGKDGWAGSMADVMGSARGVYTPDMVFLLKPFAKDDYEGLPSGIAPPCIDDPNEVRKWIQTSGKSLLKFEIVKGRDGVQRGTIDLVFSFKTSAFDERGEL
jgi:hypothetical protein